MATGNILRLGGTDFLNMTSILTSYSRSSNTSTYVNMLSVTGSGILNMIKLEDSSSGDININIIADGVTVASGLNVIDDSIFSLLIPFKTSLVVQMNRPSATYSTAATRFVLSYLLK